jgi:chromosomal replication initiation ATPase DnaA
MNAEQAWEYVLEQLWREMPRQAWTAWVCETKFVRFEQGWFTVAARSMDACEWLEARLKSTVVRKLSGMMNEEVRVRFVPKLDEKEARIKRQKEELQPDLF